MFLIYKIDEIYRDMSVTHVLPADAIYDVFYKFEPSEFTFVIELNDISFYQKLDSWMDCGDWSKGYTTYYNYDLKEKYLVVKVDFPHDNPTIIKMIREYRLSHLL